MPSLYKAVVVGPAVIAEVATSAVPEANEVHAGRWQSGLGHGQPDCRPTASGLHKLEEDPLTAPIVQRIFTEYIAGRGMTSIARGLTHDGIACPSAYDRKRNPHRHNDVWESTAIHSILLNPRYTGHQAWNKQRTDEVLIDVEDIALGHESKHVKVRGTNGDAGRARRKSTRP